MRVMDAHPYMCVSVYVCVCVCVCVCSCVKRRRHDTFVSTAPRYFSVCVCTCRDDRNSQTRKTDGMWVLVATLLLPTCPRTHTYIFI